MKSEPERVKNSWKLPPYEEAASENNIPLKETETPIIPIMTYEDIRTFVICRELLKEGVYMSIRYIACRSSGSEYDPNQLYCSNPYQEQMEEAAEKLSRSLQISRWTLISSVYRQKGCSNRFG